MQLRAGILAAIAALATVVAAGDGSAVRDGRSDVCGRLVEFGPATPPFRPSLQLPTLGEATRQLAFAPRLPAGRPFRAYVSRERERRLRRLGLAYRGSPSRWFQLTQGRLFVSVSRFEQSLRELAARDGCGARSSTFRLANGTLALLTEARDRRLVVFRHRELELMLLASPEAASSVRLHALANALAQPAATADVRHSFDMRALPYPHGVLYTVAISRSSGPVPRFRRTWTRFSSDASYTSGLTGTTRLGTLALRPGAYLVSASARPISTSAGSITLGTPQDRCARRIETRAAKRLRIDVFAKSGRPCSVDITAR